MLYKLFEENRDYVTYEDISKYFVDALIATEDQRFRDNPGVDRKGTLRAGITDIRYGKSQ
ncbi:transglycosylase domain-containing protein [Patescibacteria group bacterium]|nr:transglycosylase domain-containing protein [Patescibacteria group bacterium]